MRYDEEERPDAHDDRTIRNNTGFMEPGTDEADKQYHGQGAEILGTRDDRRLGRGNTEVLLYGGKARVRYAVHGEALQETQDEHPDDEQHHLVQKL